MNPHLFGRAWSTAGLVLAGAAIVFAPGCAGSGGEDGSGTTAKAPTARGATGDPLADMLNNKLQGNVRQQALEAAWAEGQAGGIEPKLLRDGLKDLIWKGGAPEKLRLRALELLLSQTDQTADTISLIRLRLPTEGNWAMVTAMSAAVRERAGQDGWSTTTASLVRSYARRVPVPPDADRPERAALLALHPGKPIERVVFDVYLDPEGAGATSKRLDDESKSREAAWELLGRLDPDGSQRTSMIAGENPSDPALAGLSRSASELGVVPVTGSELAWLNTLLAKEDTANAGWWTQAAAGVASLGADQRRGLGLRHIEPVRWASVHRPAWLTSSREQLLSELTQRLDGRRTWRSTQKDSKDGLLPKELLRDWQDRLSYGDVLAILVVDEALRGEGVAAALFKEAEADRTDSSTEYGGVLFAREAMTGGSGEGFVVRAYPPRPAQRVNDRTFVAAPEMFSQTGRSLAHYHFHAQTPNNAEYAGPGAGDADYAKTHGRVCVVLTSVRTGVLNADVYFRVPDGVASVDLGEITGGK